MLGLKFRRNVTLHVVDYGKPEPTVVRVRVRKGSELRIKRTLPYVDDLGVERCNLILPNGNEVFAVRYSSFRFL